MDFYGFYTGTEFEAYQFLGAHITPDGVVFRTFAPNAAGISLIGDFNEWNGTQMYKIHDGNFWECKVSNAAQGMIYKYRIYK
ncbi:MAG: glycogen-branching enzyme, partial [Lachnospiraceae bacterium]|nr:glycogen-branching enzyme [Lachnospiraceae bacterium]